MFDVGDAVPLTFRAVSAVQALVDATVTLVVEQPDGSSVSPTVTHAGLGTYTAVLVPALAGAYRLRWAASGASTSAHEDVVNVGAFPPSIIGVEELRAQLNLRDGSDVDDEELREYAAAATWAVENHTKEIVARRSVTEVLSGGWRRGLVLGYSPVLAVTAAQSVDGVAWDPANLRVTPSGVVYVLSGPVFVGAVTVTYLAGYRVVPPNYLLAAKIIAAHLWETQQRPLAGPRPGFAGEETLSPSGIGFAIPSRAVELLGGRPPLIA